MKLPVAVLLALMLVISIPGVVGEETNQVRIIYFNDWSGTIGSSGNTYSVEGSGNETIDVDERHVAATIMKDDNGSDPLTVQILHDGKVVEEQTTTAVNGIVRVNHIFKADASDDKEDNGGVCCLLLILLVIVVLMFLLKRYRNVEYRLPWVVNSPNVALVRSPAKKPVGEPRQPPPDRSPPSE